MAIVDCGRADCTYNEKNTCSRSRITLRSGRCKMYMEQFDTLRLMNINPPGVHREHGKFKNNSGRIVK